MLKPVAVLALTLAAIGAAAASSPDAWEEFAIEVEDACRAATEQYYPNATIVVDPFGSESFGLAIVTGETASLVCVFDKLTGTVEFGGELSVKVTPVPAQ